ncbi:MAG: tetratricopeptide repeat protein [Chloroflexota bacterium]
MEDPTRQDPADPETAYDLLQRGTALLEGRHHAQAAIVLERANRLEPGKGSILEALGRAYYNSGQAERAAATFEALLDVDPSSHFGHYALGQSLKRLGRRREAGTHLRLAVALSPGTRLYRDALARLGSGPATHEQPAAGDEADRR